ncbi:MAG TPA: glycosyl transferase [Xanthomonadales bacterium]|nr:glycosyl transferase [Xanthomonadales bacterium]
MSGLTVVQVLPALDAGGVERSTLEIAAALVAAGHRARVVSAGGRLVPDLLAAGAEHHRLDIGRKSPITLFRHRPLRRLIADADIVHARSRLPAWLAWWALAGLRPRPQFVTTIHGLNSPSRYSRILTQGQPSICVSETVRRHVLDHYHDLDPDRLVVIPRGIDPNAFPRCPDPPLAVRWRLAGSGSPISLPFPPNSRCLLLPARATRLKGHRFAIDLLCGLRRHGLDVHLAMPGAVQAGRERYLIELRRQAAEAGVGDRLHPLPPSSAMATWYAASDLVLQLSERPEAFGRTVLEALATGRPVVGWAQGGVGELLAELQPRGAVPPFDRDALLARVIDVLAEPGPGPVTIPYTLARMQDRTLELYARLCHH